MSREIKIRFWDNEVIEKNIKILQKGIAAMNYERFFVED